jgi:hypothetical protein
VDAASAEDGTIQCREQTLRRRAAEYRMRIRDTDPKQGAEYYTRYHFRDITVFDLDEECKPIISLPLSSIISTLHHLPSIRGEMQILLCSIN